MNTVYPRTSSLAVVSLVFGILAWLPPVLPVVGALIAVVCGHSARSEIRRAPPGSIDGDGMALAGLILGWLQLGLGVLVLGLVILFLAGLVAFHQFH
ncbi:MAG TPA: DUF4190 domain-containing protein [Rhodanobacteraceae bacterium]|jgi:thiol:disulfide interchange protein|nr:DUF4190 domain-containing protein [Rhodanobacteraceae bacterium]